MGEGFLTADEERVLISRSQAGDINARNTLVERNYRMICSLSAKHAGRCGGRAEDYIGEASIAYVRCIEKFDLSRGLRLSSMATQSICNALNSMVRSEAYVISIQPLAQRGLGSSEVVAAARRVMSGTRVADETLEDPGEIEPYAGPCYPDVMAAATILPFEEYVVLDRTLNGWTTAKIGRLLGRGNGKVASLRAAAVEKLKNARSIIEVPSKGNRTKTRRRQMALSNAQILRVLVENLKVIPAVIDAVEDISEADGIAAKADGVKHLIDLLVPVIQDLEPMWNGSVFAAADEDEGVHQNTFASAGINWEALLKALPTIVSTIEMVLALLQTSKESK